MLEKIKLLLTATLPSETKLIVKETKSCFGDEQIKIMFAVSAKEIHQVREQFPQCVSLLLDVKSKELSTQIYGGMGGQSIFRQPNKEVASEAYLAMKRVRVPFRTPIRKERNVLMAIERFANNWIKALKENKEVLMYKDYVDYDKFLNS